MIMIMQLIFVDSRPTDFVTELCNSLLIRKSTFLCMLGTYGISRHKDYLSVYICHVSSVFFGVNLKN